MLVLLLEYYSTSIPMSISALVSLIGVAGAAFVAIRIFRQRELHVERLWIVPLVALCLLAATYERLDFSPAGCLVMLVALPLGFALGWMRASLMIERVDVPNRRIVTKRGGWMLLIVVALALAKLLLKNTGALEVQQLANGGMLMAVASVCAQRLCFFRAFRRASAATANGGPSSIVKGHQGSI
jgi:hypothetical protein